MESVSIFPGIPELEIFGVYDRGVATRERIVLRPQVTIDLASYAITLGIDQAGNAIQIADQYFWLGKLVVMPPCWVFVYTGRGITHMTRENITKEPAHVLFWNRDQTLFATENIVPILLRIDGLQIGNKKPKTLPRSSADVVAALNDLSRGASS